MGRMPLGVRIMNYADWLNNIAFVGNEPWRLIGLFGSLLAAMILGKVGRHALTVAAKRLSGMGRGVASAAMTALSESIGFLVFVVGLEAGVRFLRVSAGVDSLFSTALSVLFILSIAWVVYRLVDVVDEWLKRVTFRTASRMDDMLAPLIRKSLRVTIVILALLQVATTLSDKPVTSLLAGLGVGGLAVALAAQDTLKNFFGSLVILADKPFELGDRIVVDGHDGPVEEVGFRSTRLRTLEGHLVTIPNGEMANKTILNIGKRPYIRRLANITVTYDTPPDKVLRAVDIVRAILKDHEGSRPDFPPRVYFNDFNDASLNIVMIYWYHPPDYWKFLAFNERVNRQILEKFNEEGIEFAFPTQTVYLAGDPRRPLTLGGWRAGES